ncbi:MAG TPA: transcription antitermination factor NusB [Candidatus Egerieicola faecale]|uniref:Transcription antitermination protein NusB n=1 Tax=Candidatus Egerieicola faecale TaxID=2840774 RepID=A0A9D1IQQ2_9FIRM|nr:transcription antitermination factor NusB [Candidatus Egerieicola faecale]
MEQTKLNRHEMRRAAFLLTFEREFFPNEPVEEMFAQAQDSGLVEFDQAARNMFLGVEAHKADLDETISKYLKKWSLSRISKVSLAVLRLAAYEMIYCQNQVPGDIVISEAVKLAQEYTSQEDVTFINGVLANLQKDL